MSRQAHYGVVAAFDRGNLRHTEPFLNAVAAGFVQRLEVFDIIFRFFGRYFVENHFCHIAFRGDATLDFYGKPCENPVRFPAQIQQHSHRIAFAFWLAEHLVSCLLYTSDAADE